MAESITARPNPHASGVSGQLDLLSPGRTLLPPPSTYHVRILRHEHITTRRGIMRRLVAEITRVPHTGELVYKPLTSDVLGISWLERALQALGMELPKVPLGEIVTAYLNALVGVEALAITYHYRHPEGTLFLTIRWLRRENQA